MKKEDLIKFYQTYRLYIFPIVIALSSLILIVFVILPQTIKLISNQQAAGGLIDRSKILQTKVSALESISSKDLSQNLNLTLAAFPAEKDYGNILGLLQRLIVQSGFSIESIALGNSSHKFGNTDSFEVKIEVKGLRSTFQNLLENLESSPRLVKISNIDVSSTLADKSISASLVLEVLYGALPQGLGTIDSSLPSLSTKDQELLNNLAQSGGSASSNLNLPTGPSSPKGKLNPFE